MNSKIFIILVIMGILVGALGLFSSASNGLYDRGMYAGLLLLLACLALVLMLISRRRTH